MRFRFHLDDKPWNGSRRLFISTEEGGRYAVVAPLQLTVVERGMASPDGPALEETREDVQDGLGKVTGFLQTALDFAWAQGMRPTEYDGRDASSELASVREHLADVRALVPTPDGKTLADRPKLK